MSSSSLTDQEFRGMLKHLDALYSTAQVLTLDAGKASTLVEDTFKRIIAIREKNLAVPSDRRHLLQLLIQVYHEQKQSTLPLIDLGQTLPITSKPQDSFKQHILTQFLKRAVPASYALLDDADRIVLALCEANRLSNADAALILGGDSDSVSLQLESAKKKLVEKVMATASPNQLDILQQSNPNEWIPRSLNEALKSDFNTVPPTLEPRIQSAFTRHHPEEVRQALSASARKAEPYDSKSRLSKGLMTIFLILAAGFIGYIGSTLLIKEPDVNLLTLSASKAPRVETVLATTELTEAETFVEQQMQWRLSLPDIENGELTGVGISEIADEVRVPVFLYRDDVDPTQEYITLYAFNYALLDQYADRIQLESDILQAIANDERFDLHDLNDKQKFVIWRSADDIFMAVTPNDPVELRNRITIN